MNRRAGSRRHRVTVQRKTTGTNARGERTESWADLYTNVPTFARYMSARELQAAAARQSEVTVEFEFAAEFDVTAADRIVWEGLTYELEPPTFDPKRRYLRIKGREGVTDG